MNTDTIDFADHLRAVTRKLAPALRAVAIAVPQRATSLTRAADRCEEDPGRDAAKAARATAYAALEYAETHYTQPGAHALADETERAVSACCAGWARHADGWPGPTRQEAERTRHYADTARVRVWLGLAASVPA